MTGTVFFIGAGPGDPDLLTRKAARLIGRARLVLYAGSLVPPQVVALAAPQAHVADSSGMSLEETHALMLEHVARGDVARVHTGDPSLYGAVREQAALLDRDGVPWEVAPGVSAAFALAARARVGFTAPGGVQSLVVTRLGGRTPVPETESLERWAASGASLAVYLSAPKAAELAATLLAGGYDPATPVVVGHRVGWPDERVARVRLDALAEAASGETRQTVYLVLPSELGAATGARPSALYDARFSHGWRKVGRAADAPSPAVYAFTATGGALGARLAEALGGMLYMPARLAAAHGAKSFTRLAALMPDTMSGHAAHLFVGAAGIAVRAVAPFLRDKWRDPAVVCVDQQGRHAISLVAGHAGGANALARQVADLCGGEAVVSTATDLEGRPAIDLLAAEAGLAVENPAAAVAVSAAVLEGRAVAVYDPARRLGDLPGPFAAVTTPPLAGPGVVVDWRTHPSGQAPQAPKVAEAVLFLRPPVLVAGLGCRRGTAAADILAALEAVLADHTSSPASLAVLASAELKADEAGLLETARSLGLPLEFLPVEVLAAQEAPNPSERVRAEVGAASVAEAAVLALGARLIAHKSKHGPVTVALGLLEDA